MALWTVNPSQNHDVYTVVYLLKDALRSALGDASFFERTALSKADVKGAGHAEIAARLGRFRDTCKTFQEREALMLTKLLRARIWAVELRRLAPEMQPEIDQFIDSTAVCEGMQSAFSKDAQRMFHGGGSLSRFLALRKRGPGGDGDGGIEAGEGPYLLGGTAALLELRVACEVFLGQVNDEFFSSSAVTANSPGEPITSYLDAAEDTVPTPYPELPH